MEAVPSREAEIGSPAQQLALWADRLRDLSAMGLAFASNVYDSDRYKAVQDIAISLLALAIGEPPEDLEPLRAPVFSRPTPLVGGDAAVIDKRGRILLILRADNHRWAMPGGALEVGETPLAGVLREVLEETGIPCGPVGLVGVFDSRRCGLASRHHIYLLTFLCRPAGEDRRAIYHGSEVLEVDWFPEHKLPADIHPGSLSRITLADRLWRGEGKPYFDR
jgi:ADP-ribose pyrophosphatase YjhB (NUDIX family)